MWNSSDILNQSSKMKLYVEITTIDQKKEGHICQYIHPEKKAEC